MLLSGLLQLNAAAGDTVLVRQVGAGAEWYTAVTSGLLTLSMVVIAIVLAATAWKLRSSYNKLNALLDRAQADLAPVAHRAGVIADNLQHITTVIRGDIQAVHETVRAATERLDDALAMAEQRVAEVNALVEVVQEEAEQTFVTTAAAVRGLRAGAMAFQDERGAADRLARRQMTDDEESDDGNDGTGSPGNGEREPGPRIRPRTSAREHT